MDKYIVAPPNGSTNNSVGAADRPWEEGHFEKLPNWQEYLAESTGYGIVSGCEPTISGLTVTVGAGIVHLADGTRKGITSTNITLDAADTTNPRIDLVYIDSAGVVAKVTGTAAASPSAPTLPSQGISVAQVSVAAGATTGTITDKRGMLPRYYNTGIVNVTDFGAVGDGVTDDTAAIQAAIDYGSYVRFETGKTYKITSTIYLKSRSIIDFNGCQLNLDIDGEAFNITEKKWINIKGGNAYITGTCSSVFSIIGNSNFDSSPGNYAMYIQIHNLNVSDAGGQIDYFVNMQVAVRDVFISNCFCYLQNCIKAIGKTVEIMIDKSVLFCHKDDGNPIDISSDQGSSKYSEGWTISDCTLDSGAQGKVILRDIWVFQVNNCYIGCDVYITKPTTTDHTKDILINNCVIYKSVEINGDGIILDANVIVSDCNIYKRIRVKQANYVDVTNVNFYGGDESIGAAIEISNGQVHYLNINNVYVSDRYNRAFLVNNLIDVQAQIDGLTQYNPLIELMYTAGRDVYITKRNITTNNATYYQAGVNIPNGAYSVGQDLVSIPFSANVGQKGNLYVCANLATVSSDAIISVINPDGMSLLLGTGWGARFIDTRGEKKIHTVIPYYCTQKCSGTIALKMQAGSCTVSYHSYLGVTYD